MVLPSSPKLYQAIMRVLRASLLDVYHEDYIRQARARRAAAIRRQEKAEGRSVALGRVTPAPL